MWHRRWRVDLYTHGTENGALWSPFFDMGFVTRYSLLATRDFMSHHAYMNILELEEFGTWKVARELRRVIAHVVKNFPADESIGL